MLSNDDFSPNDYWKALILYGLNQATYKIGLGKTLLSLSAQGYNRVPWDVLAREFFNLYRARLDVDDPLPQQATPGRQTAMERIVAVACCRFQRHHVKVENGVRRNRWQ